MKKIYLLFILLISASCLLQAQNRTIARGAEPGELYLAGTWYVIYNPIWGPPYCDTMRTAIYHITEHGRKLTLQYDADVFADQYTPPGSVMQPKDILADATPGVIYSRCTYSKNNYSYTALWVSFDYGKNWMFREENIGSKAYFAANVEGLIHSYQNGKVYESEDYGFIFYETNYYFTGGEPGLQYKEAFDIGAYNNKFYFLHTSDFYETVTEIPIDTLCSNPYFIFPDIYRGGTEGEAYISSWFTDHIFKISFSADTGYTFRHVFVSESFSLAEDNLSIQFMSDREPGVFYIFRHYQVEDTKSWGRHHKLCIEYYRDYGETLEAIFCHDITKNYEYEEAVYEHVTSLNSEVVNLNSVQLQWVNSADNIRGYHVYRNNVRITNYELRENTYLDENLPDGNYEYYVRAYYEEGCVSDSSNHVRESVGLGVKEVKELDGVMVYPNPTTGELRITNYELQITNVEIFDVYGRQLSSHHLIVSSSHHLIIISHLQAGLYFVKITTEKGFITKKIIKY